MLSDWNRVVSGSRGDESEWVSLVEQGAKRKRVRAVGKKAGRRETLGRGRGGKDAHV
jgi:hypothetical protein